LISEYHALICGKSPLWRWLGVRQQVQQLFSFFAAGQDIQQASAHAAQPAGPRFVFRPYFCSSSLRTFWASAGLLPPVEMAI